MNIKPILIIAGEPYSVFSELLFKIFTKEKFRKPIVIIGSIDLIIKQMKYLKYKIKINRISENYKKSQLIKNALNIINVNFRFKKTFDVISSISKDYNKECFELSIKLLKRKKFSGLINGPISKKHFIKNKYYGITEYFAEKSKIKNFAMLIYNKKLSVSPLTTHVPLKKVSKLISKKKLINHIKLIKTFYKKNFNTNASIIVTGLNPHCESNYKDSEENRIIKPAINSLKKNYSKISGPHAADSAFIKNNLKGVDVVVGMYHDQVLGPIKSIHNFDAINITLGLPFFRISPDHGPNNKMIGKNKSNPQSLYESIKFLDNQ